MDQAWEEERQRLQQDVKDAVLSLLEHTGSSGLRLQLGDERVIVVGTPDGAELLLRMSGEAS